MKMWKKGLIGVFAGYVLISLCEWGTRLAYGAKHGLLAYAWTMVEPVLLFVYVLGGNLRELVRLIRIEDGLWSFVDTFLFFVRLASGPFDFVWGFVHIPFWDFVPHGFSIPMPSWPALGFVVFGALSLALFLFAYMYPNLANKIGFPVPPVEHASAVSPNDLAPPVSPKRVPRSRANKD